MPAFKLLTRLIVYYAVLAAIVAAVLWQFPGLQSQLPIGRVQALIAEADGAKIAGAHASPVLAAAQTAGPGLVWMIIAVFGAVAAALPVSWTYMAVRNPHDYDQSLVDTIIVMPLVVTSIVVVVQHSLALSFSLAGIAGAARFRNSMKSSGDLLFILLAIGMGLSAGIGALELALVTSAAFNLCFVVLWATRFGERAEMKRFLGEFEPEPHPHPGSTTTTTTTALVAEVTEVKEVTEAAEPAKKKPKDDDDDDD